MVRAAQHIAAGEPVQCDIGRGKTVNARFNYVAAFGAFTEVSYATPQHFKKICWDIRHMYWRVLKALRH